MMYNQKSLDKIESILMKNQVKDLVSFELSLEIDKFPDIETEELTHWYSVNANVVFEQHFASGIFEREFFLVCKDEHELLEAYFKLEKMLEKVKAHYTKINNMTIDEMFAELGI